MTEDCRNDCVEPLEFPREIHNRPGLPRLDYRIGTYSDFYQAILRRLDSDGTLRSWTHREPDDPGIALLGGVSVLGDILTFYQELYANEAYLRTARWRESVAELVRLLGYRLSPGLGGRATFAFGVSGEEPVKIPARFPLKVQLEDLDQQADFETAEETVAYPAHSNFNLFRPLSEPNISQQTTEFRITSPDQYDEPLDLEEGDRLLVGEPYSQTGPFRLLDAEILIVDYVREMHGVRLFGIKGSLGRTGSVSALAAYRLGRSFGHFGNNAPPQVITIIKDGNANPDNTNYVRPLNGDTTYSSVVPNPLPGTHFPLDEEVIDLPLGTTLICQTILRRTAADEASPVTFALVRKIQETRQTSCRWGAVNGRSTVVVLDSGLATTTDHTYDRLDIREVRFHETIGSPLTLRAAEKETATTAGQELYFYGTGAEAQSLKERRLLFAVPGKDAYFATVTSTKTASGEPPERTIRRSIVLDRDVAYADFPHEEPTVVVYGNLVEATQGKTEREAVLGNGDARQTYQTFKLPKAPLTYHYSVGVAPPEAPELRIYVDDRLWTRVPSFFGRGPGEEIYVVREDVEGESWVQFGDGKTGKRLPSGFGNVVAVYRTGTGAHGALARETTVLAGDRLDRLDRIELPGVVSGGAEPETEENAREAAPGKIQSLDRLVSLKDFESETLAIAGVSKALAAWGLYGNIPCVELTILMETGRDEEFGQVQQIVADYNRCRGPQRFPVRVRQGEREYVCVGADVAFDRAHRPEEVEKDIKEALGLAGEAGIEGSRGLFALADRTFGQDEYANRVAGTIQNVEGVLWTRVAGLASLGEDFPPAPCPAVIPSNGTIPCEGSHVLALYAGGLLLNRVAAPAAEACRDG